MLLLEPRDARVLRLTRVLELPVDDAREDFARPGPRARRVEDGDDFAALIEEEGKPRMYSTHKG